VKNIKSKTRLVLTAYFYEVQVNIFVGVINFKLAEDILKFLREKVCGREQAILIREDKSTVERFNIQYINCSERYIDFDGVKFFK
jgi:hypothetical protein